MLSAGRPSLRGRSKAASQQIRSMAARRRRSGEVREPIACDKQVFLAEAKRAGFNPNANAEHVLKTLRNRCRPKFTGEFDGYDCALMQKFADAFDIDDSSNSQ